MRLPPPPNLPEGGTPAGRLDMTYRKLLTVAEAALAKEEAKETRARVKKQEAR